MTAPAVVAAAAGGPSQHPAARVNQTRIVRELGPTTRLRAEQTLHKMQEIVRRELALPLVWETARDIIANVPERNEIAQAQAIRAWMNDQRFRFVNDPWDIQLLTSPTYLLEHIKKNGYVMGNCADAAMLSAALCLAVHLRCRFYAVAFAGDPSQHYAHVFTVAYPNGAAVEMDVTRPANLKKAHFSRRLFVDV